MANQAATQGTVTFTMGPSANSFTTTQTIASSGSYQECDTIAVPTSSWVAIDTGSMRDNRVSAFSNWGSGSIKIAMTGSGDGFNLYLRPGESTGFIMTSGSIRYWARAVNSASLLAFGQQESGYGGWS